MKHRIKWFPTLHWLAMNEQGVVPIHSVSDDPHRTNHEVIATETFFALLDSGCLPFMELSGGVELFGPLSTNN